MKQKQNNIHKRKFIVAGLLAAIIATTGTGGTIFALHNNTASPQTAAETRDNKAVDSMFSFSDSQGWWQGVTTKKSMVVFDNNKTHACFVMFEYVPGTVNADTEISKIDNVLIKENYTITPLNSLELDMQVNSRPLQYELRQSAVTTPLGSSKVKGGQAFGYVQLTSGYVKIAGYCDTPEQLPSIVTALKAVTFKQPE
jgi:hypothetical protein